LTKIETRHVLELIQNDHQAKGEKMRREWGRRSEVKKGLECNFAYF